MGVVVGAGVGAGVGADVVPVGVGVGCDVGEPDVVGIGCDGIGAGMVGCCDGVCVGIMGDGDGDMPGIGAAMTPQATRVPPSPVIWVSMSGPGTPPAVYRAGMLA